MHLHNVREFFSGLSVSVVAKKTLKVIHIENGNKLVGFESRLTIPAFTKRNFTEKFLGYHLETMFQVIERAQLLPGVKKSFQC